MMSSAASLLLDQVLRRDGKHFDAQAHMLSTHLSFPTTSLKFSLPTYIKRTTCSNKMQSLLSCDFSTVRKRLLSLALGISLMLDGFNCKRKLAGQMAFSPASQHASLLLHQQVLYTRSPSQVFSDPISITVHVECFSSPLSQTQGTRQLEITCGY